MSTRCQIAFYKEDGQNIYSPDALIYRHSDGYPGAINGKKIGVLPDIIPMLRDYRERRGDGIEYCSAQLLHHLMGLYDDAVAKYEEPEPGKPRYMARGYMGHGICGDKQFHRDIEYLYAVYPEAVIVFEVCGLQNFKKIKTVSIAGTKKPVEVMDARIGKNMRADLLI